MVETGRVEVRPTWLFVTTLAGLSMLGPFAIDAILPAFSVLGEHFGASAAALQQTLSVYLLAYAAMSLIHGPLSDALGRKPVMATGMALFVASSLAAGFVPSFTLVLVCRGLQGAAAGAGQIVSRAQVRDVFTGDRAQRTMAQVAMLFALGPALAPIIGGLLVVAGSWRGVFWFQAAYGLVMFLLIVLWMPETHPPAARTALDLRTLVAGMVTVVRSGAGRRLAVVPALAFGGQFVLISSASLFIVDLLDQGATDFWMLFVPLIGGGLVGSWVSARAAGRVPGPRLATIGYLTSLAAAVVLVVFALVPGTAVLPWIVLPIPVFTFGLSVAFPVLTLAMLDLFPHTRGGASSVQAFVSLVFQSAISGLLAPILGRSLPTLMAGVLAFILVTCGLWWWHRRAGRDVAGP